MKKLSKNVIFRIVTSLLLAYILWAFAITSTDPIKTTRFSDIPIEFINVEDGYGVRIDTPAVTVKLYGRTLQLSKITKSDIKATVDLSGMKAEGTFTLEVKISGVPQNVDISEISPQYIPLSVYKLQTILADYSIEFIGEPATGYVLLSHTEEVKRVSVTASQADLQNIASIKGTVDLSGVNSDKSVSVTLKAYDAHGGELKNVTLSPSEVSAYLSVGKKKVVDVKAEIIGQCAPGHRVTSVTLSSPQITIAGKEDAIQQVNSISTDAITLTDRTSSFNTTVSLNAPDGITIIGGTSVTVTVTIESAEEKTLQLNNIQVRNLPNSFSCNLSSFNNLNITVSGEYSVISALTETDIEIYIDLSGYEEGTHEVEIHYTLPEGVSVKSMSVTKVTVVLTPKD